MTFLVLGLNEYTAAKWQEAVHQQDETLLAMALTQQAEAGLIALVVTDERVRMHYLDPPTGLPIKVTYAGYALSRLNELSLRHSTLSINNRALTFPDDQSATAAAALISEVAGLKVTEGMRPRLTRMTAELPPVALSPPARPRPTPSKKVMAALLASAVSIAAAAGLYAVQTRDTGAVSASGASTPATSTTLTTSASAIPSAPTEVTPSLSASNAAAAEYLSQLPGVDIFVNGSDKLTLGNFLCDSLRDGDSTRSIVIRMQDVDYQADEIGAYLGAATSTLCPAYYSQVEADLRSFASGN
jgi:hypothetical protein